MKVTHHDRHPPAAAPWAPHAPRPWRADEDYNSILDANGNDVADVYCGDNTKAALDSETLEFILAAVNNFTGAPPPPVAAVNATQPDEATVARDWLILKDGYYYRPNRAGYTKEVSAAGRYTKAEADREAAIEPWHMSAVHITTIPTTQPAEATVERVGRAIADADMEDYMEDWKIYDKRARAAIAALAPPPGGEGSCGR